MPASSGNVKVNRYLGLSNQGLCLWVLLLVPPTGLGASNWASLVTMNVPRPRGVTEAAL
jgi:hypothetical protein